MGEALLRIIGIRNIWVENCKATAYLRKNSTEYGIFKIYFPGYRTGITGIQTTGVYRIRINGRWRSDQVASHVFISYLAERALISKTLLPLPRLHHISTPAPLPVPRPQPTPCRIFKSIQYLRFSSPLFFFLLRLWLHGLWMRSKFTWYVSADFIIQIQVVKHKGNSSVQIWPPPYQK